MPLSDENPTKVLIDGVQLVDLTRISVFVLSPRYMYADGRPDIARAGYGFDANWQKPSPGQRCEVEIRHYSGRIFHGRCTWEFRDEADDYLFVAVDGTLKVRNPVGSDAVAT
jgi:hypothetical protein